MRSRVATLAALLIAGSLPSHAQQKWTDYRDAERGFFASFPGVPKLTTRQLAGNMPLTLYEYQITAAQKVYEVSVLEFTAGLDPEKHDIAYLSRLIASYAKGSGSTLRSQNPVTIGARPGLEAVTEDPVRDRYYLIDVLPANARVYLLVSEGAKGHDGSADAKRFRDSFKLMGR